MQILINKDVYISNDSTFFCWETIKNKIEGKINLNAHGK